MNKFDDEKDCLYYSIVIKGYVRSDYFEGWDITVGDNLTTTISSHCQDQAQLFGALRRIQDLGMELVSVNSTVKDY